MFRFICTNIIIVEYMLSQGLSVPFFIVDELQWNRMRDAAASMPWYDSNLRDRSDVVVPWTKKLHISSTWMKHVIK